MPARLTMTGVRKAFGATQALRGVDLELQPGEVHALVGENGAGKSTLIKVVTGAHRPDAGTLEIRGQPVTDNDPVRARQLGVAAIYQQPALFPDLTVAHVRAHWENWIIVVVQYAPVSQSRSIMRAWHYPAPFPTHRPPAWYDVLTRPVTTPFRKLITSAMVKMILDEDNAVCERQQSIAQQLSPAPILGALEERLAWYEEAYTEAMRAI